MQPQTQRPCSVAFQTFLLHLSLGCKGVSSMSDDVASIRSGTETDTRTRTDPISSSSEPRASTRMGGDVFVMVVRCWCLSVPSFSQTQSYRQSFSPTAVGERRLNLAKSLRSSVMRWHDAALGMIDLLRLSSELVEWCRGFPLLPHRIVISQNK